ncbi:MAG: phosphoribosylglycinamide formyltransferase [Bacteroidetes bacterium]|nr:MAG: phosphoribosylglycinamide formyltransferase [Bacteroidota bacterium]
MQRIAIFASGSGTNAQRIMEYFRDHPKIAVHLVLSNKAEAPVLERARKFHIPTVVFTRDEFYNSRFILDILSVQGIDLLVLAGFLWLIPDYLIHAFPRRIINIHPALLPKYGGKGMYGMRVHEAVIQSGDRESGISIHYVNEQYDEGELIFQAQCPIELGETPETLASKVHELEYRHYPEVIEKVMGDEGSRVKGQGSR